MGLLATVCKVASAVYHYTCRTYARFVLTRLHFCYLFIHGLLTNKPSKNRRLTAVT
jgi:hypothetical protein